MRDYFMPAAGGGFGGSLPPSLSAASADREPPIDLKAEFKRAHDGRRKAIADPIPQPQLRPDGATEYIVNLKLDERARAANRHLEQLLHEPEAFSIPEEPPARFNRESGLAKARLRQHGPEVFRYRNARSRGDDHDR